MKITGNISNLYQTSKRIAVVCTSQRWRAVSWLSVFLLFISLVFLVTLDRNEFLKNIRSPEYNLRAIITAFSGCALVLASHNAKKYNRFFSPAFRIGMARTVILLIVIVLTISFLNGALSVSAVSFMNIHRLENLSSLSFSLLISGVLYPSVFQREDSFDQNTVFLSALASAMLGSFIGQVLLPFEAGAVGLALQLVNLFVATALIAVSAGFVWSKPVRMS